MTADLIARLRAGTVTPADLDAAADALSLRDFLESPDSLVTIDMMVHGDDDMSASAALLKLLDMWEALK